MPRHSLLVQYFVTQETPVPLPSVPVSATRDWPVTPVATSMTPSTPMFQRPSPLHAVSEIPDEKDYEMQVIAMRRELGHDDEAPPTLTINTVAEIGDPGKRLSIPPLLGDEVLLEFGRPPLRQTLRAWSEGFGRRACVYGMFVCSLWILGG